MKLYYFVGGPTSGHEEAFLQRLAEVGGTPPGWLIHPHASGDGRALHIVEAESEKSILAHLARLEPIYEHGPIVEILSQPS